MFNGDEFVRNQGEANEVMTLYKKRRKGGQIKSVTLRIAFTAETIRKGTSLDSVMKVAKDSSWKLNIAARFNLVLKAVINVPSFISGDSAVDGGANAGYAKEASTSSITTTKQMAIFEDGGLRTTPVLRLDINYVKNKTATNEFYTRYRVANGLTSEEKVTLSQYLDGQGQVSGDFLHEYNESQKMDLFCYLHLQPTGSARGDAPVVEDGTPEHTSSRSAAQTAGQIILAVKNQPDVKVKLDQQFSRCTTEEESVAEGSPGIRGTAITSDVAFASADGMMLRKQADSTCGKKDIPPSTVLIRRATSEGRLSNESAEAARQMHVPVTVPTQNGYEVERTYIKKIVTTVTRSEQTTTCMRTVKVVQRPLGTPATGDRVTELGETPVGQVHSAVPRVSSWSLGTQILIAVLFLLLAASLIILYWYIQQEKDLQVQCVQRRQWSGLNFFIRRNRTYTSRFLGVNW
jgi:hypothetical protein